jgi:hypothetical protein
MVGTVPSKSAENRGGDVRCLSSGWGSDYFFTMGMLDSMLAVRDSKQRPGTQC